MHCRMLSLAELDIRSGKSYCRWIFVLITVIKNYFRKLYSKSGTFRRGQVLSSWVRTLKQILISVREPVEFRTIWTTLPCKRLYGNAGVGSEE